MELNKLKDRCQIDSDRIERLQNKFNIDLYDIQKMGAGRVDEVILFNSILPADFSDLKDLSRPIIKLVKKVNSLAEYLKIEWVDESTSTSPGHWEKSRLIEGKLRIK